MPPVEPVLVCTRNESVVWLRLNRPEVLNALDSEMIDRLDGQLAQLEHDPSVRVVVLTGTGGAFSAGGDLGAMAPAGGTLSVPALLAFLQRGAALIERVAAFPKPVIAAVNGLAVAGGLELVMACDFAVAAESARLGDGHVKYGLLPGAGGAVRLPRIIGPRRAKALLFSGRVVPARDLVAPGLVAEVVPDHELTVRVDELARLIATKSPATLRALKRLVDDGLDRPIGEALQMERRALETHLESPDLQEGLAAFREDRTPVYSDQ